MIDFGLDIKKAIYSQVVKMFLEEDNLYYWYTILRKLRKIQKQNKEDAELHMEITTLYNDVVEILEQERSGAGFHILQRTTDLLTAIDDEDLDSVKILLEKHPQTSGFLCRMRLIPGTFFPSDTMYHMRVNGSPLGKFGK